MNNVIQLLILYLVTVYSLYLHCLTTDRKWLAGATIYFISWELEINYCDFEHSHLLRLTNKGTVIKEKINVYSGYKLN